MTTGLLRGLGLLVERGRSVHAMSGACMPSNGSVRCMRAVARVVEGGWGQAEYYGLCVAR